VKPYAGLFPVVHGTAERPSAHRHQPAVQAALAPGREPPPQRDLFDARAAFARLPGWGALAPYGPPDLPAVVVASFVGDYVDVFVPRGHDRCGGYCARIWPDQNPVEVHAVTWSLPGDLATVLGGLMSLGPVERGLPDYDMPPELRELMATSTEPRWLT
jgi:hypothetical protein